MKRSKLLIGSLLTTLLNAKIKRRFVEVTFNSVMPFPL